MLTGKEKSDWTDRFSGDEWEQVMEARMFPAVMNALEEGDLARAERLMHQAIGLRKPLELAA